MFSAAGDINVKIIETMIAEPKWDNAPEGAFDVCLKVQAIDDPNQADWWRGEVSNQYGKGNFADRTQAQLTFETLGKIGFQGNDLTTLDQQLLNKETVAHIKANEAKDGSGKVFYNVSWLGEGSGSTPKAIDQAEMQRRVSAMFGGGAAAAPAPAAAPDPQPAPPVASAPAGNPFA